MHEVGIASEIIQAVRAKRKQHAPSQIRSVGVRVGKLAGIDTQSLAFCFEVLVRGTDLAPLQLVIETGEKDELELAFLELEEP